MSRIMYIEGRPIQMSIKRDQTYEQGENFRRRKFFEQLYSHGITVKMTDNDIVQKATQIKLGDARKLHSLSLRFRSANHIGAVAIEENRDNFRLSDVNQPDFAVKNIDENLYWQMHFYPYSSNDRLPQYALDTAFLAYTDMMRVSEAVETAAEQPGFIYRITNPTMANFARTRLRFHLAEAKNYIFSEEKGYTQLDSIPEDEVEEVFRERVANRASFSAYDTQQQIWFGLFLTRAELLSPEYRDYLERMRQDTYEKARDEKGITHAESADEYEVEIRLRAIVHNLIKVDHEMREEEETSARILAELEEIEARLTERKKELLEMQARRRSQ